MPNNTVQQLVLDQSTSLVTLKKALDAQAMRQRAHAQNIANAETPGYRRVAVDFEEQLKETLENNRPGGLARSDLRHLKGDGAQSLADLEATVRSEQPDPDGSGVNGVDLEREMAEMAETQIRYMASIELLKRRYASLKMAIRGQ